MTCTLLVRIASLSCVSCLLSLASCSSKDPGDGLGDNLGGDTTGSNDSTSAAGETSDGWEDETGESGETSGETGGETGEDPGQNAYCEPVAAWDQSWADYELEVLALLNAARIEARECGAAGKFEAAPELVLDPALHCAARIHAMDMALRDYVDHVNPEGQDFDARFEAAGYPHEGGAESLGAGYPTPTDVVEAWLGSDVHCANVMSPSHVDVGIGYAFGPNATYAHYWTLTLGDAG